MKTRLRLIIATLIAFSLLVGLAPRLVLADICTDGTPLTTQQSIQCGTNGASGGNTKDSAQATKDFNSTVRSLLNILSVVVGIVAVIMVITAGFRFITSGGSQERVKGARNALMYAVVGLVIVAMAQIIVQFVLAKASESTTTGQCVLEGGRGYVDSVSGQPCTP